jgi:hypothetical protein
LTVLVIGDVGLGVLTKLWWEVKDDMSIGVFISPFFESQSVMAALCFKWEMGAWEQEYVK